MKTYYFDAEPTPLNHSMELCQDRWRRYNRIDRVFISCPYDNKSCNELQQAVRTYEQKTFNECGFAWLHSEREITTEKK